MTEFQKVIIGDNQLHMENMSIPDVWTESDFHVRFLCVYSTGYPTITGAQLNDDYTLDEENLITGDGDGTLSTEELESCEPVSRSMRKRKTRVVHLPGVNHAGILTSHRALRIIRKFLERL